MKAQVRKGLLNGREFVLWCHLYRTELEHLKWGHLQASPSHSLLLAPSPDRCQAMACAPFPSPLWLVFRNEKINLCWRQMEASKQRKHRGGVVWEWRKTKVMGRHCLACPLWVGVTGCNGLQIQSGTRVINWRWLAVWSSNAREPWVPFCWVSKMGPSWGIKERWTTHHAVK